MSIEFNKKTWLSRPNTSTPITADELNRIEEAIETVVSLINSGIISAEQLANYVMKVDGKGLSKNDFTDVLKAKLEGISSDGGDIQPDWSTTDDTQSSFIKNKPTSLSDFTDDEEHRTTTDEEKATWNSKQNAIPYIPESTVNKSYNLEEDKESLAKYPTCKTVFETIYAAIYKTVPPIIDFNGTKFSPIEFWSEDDIDFYRDPDGTWVMTVDANGELMFRNLEPDHGPIVDFNGKRFSPTQFWSKDENGFYQDPLGTWIMSIANDGQMLWKNTAEETKILEDETTGIRYTLKIINGAITCEPLAE